MSDSGLRAVSRAIAWQGASNVGVRLLRAGLFLVLARLLSEQSFGEASFAMVSATFALSLSSGGLSQVIIQRSQLDRHALDVAFTINIGLGVLLAIVVLALAGPAGMWLHSADVGWAMVVLACVPIIGAASVVPIGILARDMQFRNLALRQIASTVCSSAAAVLLAVLGFGLWALILQTVTDAAVSCIVLWVSARSLYRPHFAFDRVEARAFLAFGSRLTLGDFIRIATAQVDNVLVGIYLGPNALGLYSVAYRLLTIVQESLIGTVSSVLFPVLSRQNEKPEAQVRTFERIGASGAITIGAAFVLIGGTAPAGVPLLLGARWAAAAPVVTVLALAGVFALDVALHVVYLTALGRPNLGLLTMAAVGMFAVAGFLLAAPLGLVPVAASLLIANAVGAALVRLLVRSWLPAANRVSLPVFRQYIVLGLAFAAAYFVTNALAGAPTVLRLLLGVGAAAVVVLALTRLLLPRVLMHLLRAARSLARGAAHA